GGPSPRHGRGVPGAATTRSPWDSEKTRCPAGGRRAGARSRSFRPEPTSGSRCRPGRPPLGSPRLRGAESCAAQCPPDPPVDGVVRCQRVFAKPGQEIVHDPATLLLDQSLHRFGMLTEVLEVPAGLLAG